jgi:acetylglutamate kinase
MNEEKDKDSKKPLLLFKYGGNAMVNEDLKEQVLENICSLKESGHNIVIIHGGGPFIGEALQKAKIESEFIDGLRKTTTEAFEYVEMALKGKVNGSLVRMINTLGQKAVGLSGKDGQTVVATKRLHQKLVDGEIEEIDLGQVGDVASTNPALLNLLLEHDYIPVMTCLAADKSGKGYNINADIFAGNIAGALEADQYIVLTDVDGLLRDKDDPASLIHDISLAETRELTEEGIIKSGMIPKIESCEVAINKGALLSRIINGTKPEQILTVVESHTPGTAIRK